MFTLHHGDCLEVMPTLPPESVSAIVTDPPYGLSFMGKDWDHGVPGEHFWREAIRLLPPSHYLLAFGGTRTWHRLACAIEDAGFEIRDTLMWLYGQGFPKGKSCLKPAWEPIILARKPGPMRELGIDGCRVGTSKDVPASPRRAAQGPSYGDLSHDRADGEGWNPNSGRWPANVILDEAAAGMVDDSGGASRFYYKTEAELPSVDDLVGICPNFSGDMTTEEHVSWLRDGEPQSRFLYCAKASRAERNAGCEGMEERPAEVATMGAANLTAKSGVQQRIPRQNHHPTIKPVALMRWLVRLVARPGDVVLDPFTGSGTTGVACALEGRDFIGIEREAEYVEIARRRIEHHSAQTRLPV